MSSDNVISVLITVFDDSRVVDTVDSLCHQTLVPDEVFVANAGLSNSVLDSLSEFSDSFPFVKVASVFGSVSESRNKSLHLIRAKSFDDIVVFIDSDEVAPDNYIYGITKPIVDGHADFTGSWYKPMHPPRNSVERYIHRRTSYHKSNFNPCLIPMGCSAWRRGIFDKIGNFDMSFKSGGEDYDINLRALNAGFVGCTVKDVFLYHDLHFDSWWSYIHKIYGYHKGTLHAYSKNGSNRGVGFFHFFNFVNFILKCYAYVSTRGKGE